MSQISISTLHQIHSWCIYLPPPAAAGRKGNKGPLHPPAPLLLLLPCGPCSWLVSPLDNVFVRADAECSFYKSRLLLQSVPKYFNMKTILLKVKIKIGARCKRLRGTPGWKVPGPQKWTRMYLCWGLTVGHAKGSSSSWYFDNFSKMLREAVWKVWLLE